MKTVFILVSLVLITLYSPSVVHAIEPNPEISNYTSSALKILTLVGSLLSTLFIITGGYSYLTSQGKPDSLEHAKKTIRNAIIGLVLILSANSFVTFLNNSFTQPSINVSQTTLALQPIEPLKQSGGLAQVLVDSIGSLIQNIVQSATKPITDSLLSYLSITPAIATNSVIFNFWLIIVGIADALFALVIALLGLHFMSASTFGFEEIELKQILPKIAVAFLGANTSIFLIDGIVSLSNVLISAVLHATGGLNQIWVTSAFNPAFLSLDRIAFITLIFMLLFVIISIVLLLFYITRLIIIAVGAVLSPLFFLLWALPRFSDFVEISIKSYLMTIFSVFVHIVVIQLSASFLNLTAQTGTNSFLSILIGIGLLLTLLKTQSFMIQLMFYNSGRSMVKKVSGQILNVMSNKDRTSHRVEVGSRVIKTPRKVVHA